MKAGIKHLLSDTAAFIISGSVIVGAIWYIADIPKKVEADSGRIGKLEAAIPRVIESQDEIKQRLARMEGQLEWLINERRNH